MTMAPKPDHSQNSSRFWLRVVNTDFARDVMPGMIVLDAGAGTQPYRDLFAHAIYESADFEAVAKAYAPSTYVCDLGAIPVEDGRFDRVILNQVLEHLPEPGSVLAELRRVLKPGGRMICTCPLFYEEHEQPYDFYRYTQFGLRHLFETAGFVVEDLFWMEGYFGTVGYQFSLMRRALPKHAPVGLSMAQRMLAWPLVLGLRALSGPLARLFWALDRRAKVTAAGLPKNYVVIARVP
jgi:SAM-dependent methyltransferase